MKTPSVILLAFMSIIVVVFLLFLYDFDSDPSKSMDGGEFQVKQAEIDKSVFYKPKSNIKQPTLKPNLKTIQINEIFKYTENYLLKKHKIEISNNEIRNYIRSEFGELVSEDSFIETKENLDAQIAAAEDVVINHADPSESAERFLHKWGGAQVWSKILKTMNKKRIEEMSAMLPKSVTDMYEKSIPGHRDIVERYELAKVLLNNKTLDIDSNKWEDKYYEYLLDYAKENLIGKVDELKDVNIDKLPYNTQNFQNIISTHKEDNSKKPPLDRNTDVNNNSEFQN